MTTEEHDFFMDHTYCAWNDFVPLDRCRKMTDEISTKQLYVERPTVADGIVQLNTRHLDTQGYTRKYHAIYGDDVKAIESIYAYSSNVEVEVWCLSSLGTQLVVYAESEVTTM
jgi:hypothetical protein